MVNPSAFAVLELVTSSNFVGCSIGRSPGLAPLRILFDEDRGSRPARSSGRVYLARRSTARAVSMTVRFAVYTVMPSTVAKS